MQQQLQINSIDGGIQPTYYLGQDNQYLAGIAIDPEGAFLPSSYSQGGMGIIPVGSSKFSTDKLSAAPMWIIPDGKDTNVYVYSADGSVISYGSAFTTENVVGTASAGAGNGGAYYNDYLYFATSADIARYGPLDGSPAFANYIWTGATLGSQAPLSASGSAIGTRNITYPNHPMHVHNDGNLYFGDYVSASGRPCLNKIATDNTGTNTASQRRVLDLPYNYVINDIESFGNDIAVLCSWSGQYGGGAIPKVGRAALFLWDTFSSVPYKQIDIADPVATAMVNHNGVLKVFSGQIGGYVRIGGFTGGNNLVPLEYIGEGSPPPAGAVDVFGDQLAWGGYADYPTTFAGVMTKGYKNPSMAPTARNCIMQITGAPSLPIVSSLNFCNLAGKYPLIGWKTNTPSQGLDKNSGNATLSSKWRSKLFNIGQEFTITRIRIALGQAVDSTTSITPTIYVDNETSSSTLSIISNGVYSGKTIIDLKTTVKGSVNFSLGLIWGSTTVMPVAFPITFTIETLKDKE